MISFAAKSPLPLFVIFMFIGLVIMIWYTANYGKRNNSIRFFGIVICITIIYATVARYLNDFAPNNKITNIMHILLFPLLLIMIFSIFNLGWKRYKKGELSNEQIMMGKVGIVGLEMGLLIFTVIFILMKLGI
jgi:uncharacterized membrane protein